VGALLTDHLVSECPYPQTGERHSFVKLLAQSLQRPPDSLRRDLRRGEPERSSYHNQVLERKPIFPAPPALGCDEPRPHEPQDHASRHPKRPLDLARRVSGHRSGSGGWILLLIHFLLSRGLRGGRARSAFGRLTLFRTGCRSRLGAL